MGDKTDCERTMSFLGSVRQYTSEPLHTYIQVTDLGLERCLSGQFSLLFREVRPEKGLPPLLQEEPSAVRPGVPTMMVVQPKCLALGWTSKGLCP